MKAMYSFPMATEAAQRRRFDRRTLRALAVAALAFVLAACMHPPETALRIGTNVWIGSEPLYLVLTSYSSMIQMPQFFAVVLILSILGILIYVLFFLIGKKWASWEA